MVQCTSYWNVLELELWCSELRSSELRCSKLRCSELRCLELATRQAGVGLRASRTKSRCNKRYRLSMQCAKEECDNHTTGLSSSCPTTLHTALLRFQLYSLLLSQRAPLPCFLLPSATLAAQYFCTPRNGTHTMQGRP